MTDGPNGDAAGDGAAVDTARVDWTDPDTFERALERADTLEKGTWYEAFAEGQVIEHEPGLRLTRWANELWTSQTLNHDPAHWRADLARERGHEVPPIHPDYLLAATLGCTVEDLSEKGGYFLGRTDVRFPADAVPAGTDLRVESEVLERRPSNSRPAYGIVTWETRASDAATDETLCLYERTNMIPRREPREGRELEADRGRSTGADEPESNPSTPFVTPQGDAFEDFETALERATDLGGAVAYRHERGRTMDDVTITALPLSTLNTAKQHHNRAAMADSPSGDIVSYGDVTRSTALGHARSDERTVREVRFEDERFHRFVTAGDTISCFTRVLETSRETTQSGGGAGTVRFQHIAFNQRQELVYSGIRTAEVATRDR